MGKPIKPYTGKLNGQPGERHAPAKPIKTGEQLPKGDAKEIGLDSWHYMRYQGNKVAKL